MKLTPIVVFAQVPPPEHGQSRMVQLGLDALRSRTDLFDVRHINARFSESLDVIGESSLRKGILIVKYLLQALWVRLRLRSPLLYYVPGPVKWSALIRDWLILVTLRPFYRNVVFHWHAIGQGEWAHGSSRLALEGPVWLECFARRLSAWILARPFASICVVHTSVQDAKALNSVRILTVCNGLADPYPDYETLVCANREETLAALAAASHPDFRILFLSHGTIAKGLMDAVDAICSLLKESEPNWHFTVTFAGGVSADLQLLFNRDIDRLREMAGERLNLQLKGYVSGEEKDQCYQDHDIFLAPSHWESFGLTVLEAMAHGMQVVAAASDGVTGILPEGYPYLAPVSSPDVLAEKIRRCCEDLLSGVGAENVQILRKRFRERYQIRDFSENLIHAFQSLSPDRTKPLQVVSDSARTGISESTGDQVSLRVYLADQNPGHDRSFGISRMSQILLETLHASGRAKITTITSQTSQQAPEGIQQVKKLPWGTRSKWARLFTDHLHPLYPCAADNIYYYPKGYLPWLSGLCRPSVVTIHDTIIQYDADHYSEWRNSWEYGYWEMMLKHTLRQADRILTVSESAKRQIQEFMHRHRIPEREIMVTYEPCAYEQLPQPQNPIKENYVIHLASREPHKRTAHLVRWWIEAESEGRNLPMLQLIGTVPPEVMPLLTNSHSIVKRPFLEDDALQGAYRGARALILPSEIEGFGLPALEAYYLGTPVCFVRGTSVEEVLSAASAKGGFTLQSPESLFAALDEVMAMSPDEVRTCGLNLRERYTSKKVAEKMMRVFESVSREQCR